MSALSGLIVAAATPFEKNGTAVDSKLYLEHCQRLLALGANGLVLSGTAGEATSLSVGTRLEVMSIAQASLPLSQAIVGTGAAAISDAIELTRAAADLGFSGSLVLPSFYYKAQAEDDLFFYFERLLRGVDRPNFPLYLYHIPQLTGLSFTPEFIERLRAAFPGVFVGLKDSEGNLEKTRQRAAALPDVSVFAATEEALGHVKSGELAGVISASMNVTMRFVAQARDTGSTEKLGAATEIRMALTSHPLIVASIKWALADLTGRPEWAQSLPPIKPLSDTLAVKLKSLLAETDYEKLRADF
ncbi:dihydrodipicolinate synthase family protein [Phyllobacterium endophyticum]|nr:dihydrodipicolinate synthase family protein [Phyllobacterium endophyticum]MBB3237075.1 4-hydroxy-tetrahydrodipicolinate synthase [Phyllobacterium endophyticum]